MLIKIKKLLVENDGYKRNISTEDIYINSNSIVSIADYCGISDFLLREESEYANEKFSLVRVSYGSKIDELIVLGDANSLFAKSQSPGVRSDRTILNG